MSQLTKEKASLEAQYGLLESNAQRKQKELEKQLLVLQNENQLLQFDKQELQRQVAIYIVFREMAIAQIIVLFSCQNDHLLKATDHAQAQLSQLADLEKELAQSRLREAELTSSAEIGKDILSSASILHGSILLC